MPDTNIKTRTITTPSNVVVEICEYLEAGDFLDLNDEAEKQSLSKTQLALRLLQLIVVSIDGTTEDIATKLRKLSIADYLFFQKEVKPLIDGNFTEAKNP